MKTTGPQGSVANNCSDLLSNCSWEVPLKDGVHLGAELR